MRGKNKLIVILTLAIFIISIVALGIVNVIESTQAAEEAARLNAIAAPYEKEKVALQRKLNNAERNFIETLSCGSALTLAHLNLYPEVYTVFYPTYNLYQMETEDGESKAVFTGTLCLSPTELPGLSERITMAEYDELISAGWSTAITVTDADINNLGLYFDTMKNTLDGLGIAMPTVAYFEDEVYDPIFDSILSEHGFTSAVLTGEHPEYYIIGQDLESDIWRVGMMGWSSIVNSSSVHTSSRVALETLVKDRGGLVFGFEVAYGDGMDRNKTTQYYPAYRNPNSGKTSLDSLKAMLSMMELYIKDDDLVVTDVENGHALYAEHIRQREFHADKLSVYVAGLEEELAAVKALLKRIYAGDYTPTEVE